MNTKLRLVYVTCSYDPWISVVLDSVLRVARDLDWEFTAIGSSDDHELLGNSLIPLEYGDYKPLFSPHPHDLLSVNTDLTHLVDIESEFMKRSRNYYGKSTGDFKKKFIQWLNEAVILLKLLQPDMLIIWNGLIEQRGIYAEAAKLLNIPLFYAEKGMLPNSWYIDSLGINAYSSIAGENFSGGVPDGDTEKTLKKLELIWNRGQSAWDQPDRKPLTPMRESFGIKPDQKVIFFPGQVDYDSNVILFSPHFKHVADVLKWLAGELDEKEYFILTKPHPKGKLTVEDFNKILGSKGLAVSELNIMDAVDIADCVVSINSTVLFEAALRKKPILLLGEGVLSNKSFASAYEKNKPGTEQILSCMQRHAKNKELYFRQALALAAYLDNGYYVGRDDLPGIRKMLESAAGKIAVSKKIFLMTELNLIFKKGEDNQRDAYLRETRKTRPERYFYKAAEAFHKPDKASRRFRNTGKFLLKSFLLNPFVFVFLVSKSI
ncbi:MAG: hypothetical protein GY757_58240, partial [bacterium]|nr:hypothetical protein [bacterium]